MTGKTSVPPLGSGPAAFFLRARRPTVEFFEMEAAGASLLVAATIVALVWANSPAGRTYHDFWNTYVSIGAGSWALKMSLAHWIKDALMAIFFFLVGLEIKRELVSGELSTPRQAALPIMAALAGMVVPALLHALLNAGGGGAPGWGIPMATDIAFALGVLVLLGRRVPLGLKVFLTALVAAAVPHRVLCDRARFADGVRRALDALDSGGPAGGHAETDHREHVMLRNRLASERWSSPLQRLEHALVPHTSFVIMPVFALAIAGVVVDGGRIVDTRGGWIPLGIILGLVVGKQAGVFAFSWLAVRLGPARLPSGVGRRGIHGAAVLLGIGFTMSLFIANLAFPDAALLDRAKVGIPAASLISGIAGTLLLLSVTPPARSEPEG